MNNYYLTVLLKNDLSEEVKKGILDTVKKQLAKITKEDLWGSRDLAYPILHQEKAYYAHFEFESEPSKISSLDKSLKLNEDVLRFLILKA